MAEQKKRSDFLAITITSELKQEVAKFCTEDEVSMSHWVRRAVRKEVNARKKQEAREAQVTA